ILRNCRAAMLRDGQVLILEEVYPARVDPPGACQGVVASDVNMLVCTGGRQRSEAEFRGLLAASGFRLSRLVPPAANVSGIQGEPAKRGAGPTAGADPRRISCFRRIAPCAAGAAEPGVRPHNAPRVQARILFRFMATCRESAMKEIADVLNTVDGPKA